MSNFCFRQAISFFRILICGLVLLFSFFSQPLYAEHQSEQAIQVTQAWRDQNLTAAEIDWLKAHPVLKMGIDRAFIPYEWLDENGRYQGMSADIIELISQRLQIAIEPVTDKSSWSEVLEAARSGEFDLMSCLVQTPERSEFLSFTEPYLISRAVIIGEQSRGYIGSLDSLKGKTVAIHTGHYTNELLRQDYPEITIINTSTLAEALRKVAEGEADAFVGDVNAASFMMKHEGIINLSFSGQTDYKSEFRIGINKDNPQLISILNKAVAGISEAERQAIFEHWQQFRVPAGISVQQLLSYLPVVIVILGLLLYWHLRLRRSEQAHRVSEARFRNLVDSTDGIVWELDIDTMQFTHVSTNAVRILGYEVEEWKSPCFWVDHMHPDDQVWAVQYCEEETKRHKDHDFEYRFFKKNGDVVWLKDVVSVVLEQGRARWLRGMMFDITAQKQAEMLVRESELKFRELIESLPAIAVQGYDEARRVIYWNKASEALYGYTSEEAIGQQLEDLIIPEEMRPVVVDLHTRWVENGEAIPPGELELKHKSGRLVPVFSSHVAMHSSQQKHEMYCIDISLEEQRRANAELTRMAHYDPLTQLPNRRTFADRLHQQMKQVNRDGTQLAVMLLDLDSFKEVNDSLGHDHGDLLLIEAARRLKQCVREVDTVARLGGDEFMIILEGLSDLAAVERVAENILQQMREPFLLQQHRAYVSASIGITIYPSDAMTMETVLKNADQAMYAAKEKGRNRYHYFTPEMEIQAQKRRLLVHHLREALEQQQFELYYQPIINFRDGSVQKAEALLRWTHPKRGMISPVDFIPVAEETGIIRELGEWVFDEAITQSAHWHDQYGIDLQMGINVSPIQFRDDRQEQGRWFRQLQDRGVSARQCCIEITESLLMEAEGDAAEKLLALRDAGVEVAMDDFGTGYSSLAYLKHFDIDYLKIDKSFVSNLQPGSADLALCEAMIVMAHKLGIRVVAEGVETEEQKNLLIGAGCDFGQGYLFGRPVPARDFARQWLESDVVDIS